MECEVAETVKIMEENVMNKKRAVLFFLVGMLTGTIITFILFPTVILPHISYKNGYDNGYNAGYMDGMKKAAEYYSEEE